MRKGLKEMAKYNSTKDAICDAVSSVFGEWHNDFIRVEGKTSDEVEHYIENACHDRGIEVDNFDKYIYMIELLGDILLKR